ncbi:hypothetical protein Tco_0240769 [Tanacetum coccineum]
MIKTRMKTPPLDQTEGRREGDQANKLIHQKNRHIRSQSPQVLQKVHPDLNQNLQASLLMQRSMNNRMMIKKINHIKSSTQGMMMMCISGIHQFLAIPIDFSAFIMHHLNIENLTQEVLTDPTYDLIKGTCKSVVELEYHLEEVFKATNDRLDWHNLKGKPYPHDLSKSSSQKYTTSITKTKAADYGHVKWIEDKGLKHQKFYGYASNMETSKDVYSRHMIIAVTSLKIMQHFGYSHLEEIIIRTQDDQLYKFREGDFKRLCRQDIEDMLLLLVQNKLSNLNLEERYALNVPLCMFTRRIVIQERVEYLQLGVKSYQKKINLKKPDTYRSDLRRMTPYTAYPNIQGIIYKDEINQKSTNAH